MKHARTSALLILSIMAAFWAYLIMEGLINEFAQDITYVDLGAIFVLGLIAGIAAGMVAASPSGDA
jgi:hypothetical protein